MRLSFHNSKLESLKNISGWGKINPVDVDIITPETIEEIKIIINNSKAKSIISRGLGRSYGDAAQIKEGKVLKLNNFKKITPNYQKYEITAQAGATFEEILKVIIPKGFFLPVTPGTKKITLGGAIAADVHGKNHHIDGSFGNYIKRIRLINGSGENIILSPINQNQLENNEKFWATIGGMGLTGIIIDATFSIIPIQTSLIKTEISRHDNLDDLMQKMLEADEKYKYSVAWIDSMNNGLRGILTCGNHITNKDLGNSKDQNYLSFNSKSFTNIPNLIPINLMQRTFIKLFNEFWFRKTSKNISKKLMTIEKFFYPLDAINNWNNIYGRKGFIQYQLFVPEEQKKLIKKILYKLKSINALTFLPVLKRLGAANQGYLSFPSPGWTLSIDLPAPNQKVENVLKEIDKEIAEIGGRFYLAKDSRQSEHIFKKTYPSLDTWKKVQTRLDPQGKFISDMAIRLRIFD